MPGLLLPPHWALGRMIAGAVILVGLGVLLLLLASCGPGPVTPSTTNVDAVSRTLVVPTPATWDARTTWAAPRLLEDGEWLTWGMMRPPSDSSVMVAVTVRLLPDGRVEGSVDDFQVEAYWHPHATALLRAAAK